MWWTFARPARAQSRAIWFRPKGEIRCFRDSCPSFAPNRRHQERHKNQNHNKQQSSRMTTTPSRAVVEETERLLQRPVLSWNSEDWKASEKALKQLTAHVPSRQEEGTSSGNMEQSFELLDRMVQEAEGQPRESFRLTTQQHVNPVLDCWRIGSRSRGKIDLKQWSAIRVLNRIDEYSTRLPSLQMDAKTYSMIMAVQIKQNPKKSPEVCQRILQRMKKSDFARPNSVALTYLMDAHVQSGQPTATHATQSIFDYMVEKSAEFPDLAPTEKSLTRLLQAQVSLSGNKRGSDGEASVEETLPRMKRALQYMIRAREENKNPRILPNALFLNLVLDHCCSSQPKTGDFTHRHNTLQSSGTSIDRADALFSYVLELATTKGYSYLMPQSHAFYRICQLWGRSGRPEAASRAEQWLDEMCRISHADNFHTFASRGVVSLAPPRASVYSEVMTAWAKSGRTEAPQRAEQIWKRRVEQTGDRTAGGYHQLIALWSQSSLPDASLRAEEHLRDMIAQSEHNPRLVPSMEAFVQVLAALAARCPRRESRTIPDDWDEKDGDKSSATNAQAILDSLLKLALDRYPDRFELTEEPFIHTLKAWAQSGSSEASTRADAILTSMEFASRIHPTAYPSSNTTFWNAMICQSPHDSSPLALRRATQLLKRMDESKDANWNREGSRQQRDHSARVRHRSYERVLSLWAASKEHQAGLRAEELLAQYMGDDDLVGESRISPEDSISCMVHVVTAWKYANSPEAETRINLMLNRMEANAEAYYKDSKDPSLYMTVAESCVRSEIFGSSTRGKDFFTRLLSLSSQQGLKIDPQWYEDMITAWSETRNTEEAMELLYLAEREGVALKFESYKAIISALATSSKTAAAEQANEVLEAMIDRYLGGDLDSKPTAEIFGSVMAMHRNQGASTEVNRLWSLLQNLQSQNPEDKDFHANSRVLLALPNDCNGSQEEEVELKHKGLTLHNLLEDIRLGVDEVVDEKTINAAMDALARSGDASAGKRAELILLKMQELYDEGRLEGQPTFTTFQKVIDCWANCQIEGSAERADEVLSLAETLSLEGDKRLQPNKKGYMSVVQIWSRSHKIDAPERIQDLITRMKRRFDEGKAEFVLEGPAYIALIDAYANSGRRDSARLARAVFDQAPPKFQDTDLYNALIGAQGGDGISAEAILQEMQKAYDTGDLRKKPNTESFNRVLLVWSRSGSPLAASRADGIFQRMDDLNRSGKLLVKPNGQTFDMVISTLANEFGADGAVKIDQYLEKLKSYYRSGEPDCAPSVTSYTEAIRAWGSNVEDPRAVLRAKALLDEMHELAQEGLHSVQPNRNTYWIYLQALSKSVTEGKEYLARDVASSMQSNGIRPDGAILWHLQRCSLPSTAVLSSWAVNLDDEEFKVLQ